MIDFIDEKGMIDLRGDHVIDADVAVTAFSNHIYQELLDFTHANKTGEVTGSVNIEVYTAKVNGKKIAIYRSPIGAPAAASALEEVYAGGVKKAIAFGICGTLIETRLHAFIVPTKAYRDEGTSYHYMPASDFIEIKNCETVARSLASDGIDVIKGGSWCTDGFYRETKSKADSMRNMGCVAVDMECSALQAVANFREKEFYTFFISADSLAGEQWQPNDILNLKATDSTTVAVAAAIKLACEIQ